ncbi:anti-sigma-D factor RsdA [Dactylosporangium sp. AC04546]|uniref:anti-sigma-D factor RsdA n=1 Tax=Dactylosporangium sp. AC04546 TaxID=2862460 RepID=UPI001EDE3EBE|nr:anti-sigma-D factor RsdA [Dactylosporangium sp. AC04546]WVK80579.1 anti-sigma-D factor RsdA [Dactylosporangium sp. AC04546]
MSEQRGEQPVDLAAVQADDALLDALGRGEPAPDGDDLAGLLAAWRADLDTDLPADDISADGILVVSAEPPADEQQVAEPVPLRRRGTGLRRAFAGVAAAALILGGLALGAHRSGPDGPLWPITRVLYPQVVDARAAEHAIAQAADAAAAGRYDEARRLLDTATGYAQQVGDPATRQRLLDRIDEIRRSLPTAPAPTAQPSSTGGGSTPDTTGPSPAPSPATTTGGPGGGGNPGGGQSPAPGIPVPNLPSLLPSLPLPSSIPLPGLP